MTVRLIACLAAALTIGIQTPQAAEPIPAETLRAAAARGLELLVKTSPTFIKKGGCNSCHNQMLPAAAQALARRHGIAAGDAIAQLSPAVSEGTAERYAEYSVAGGAGVNALAYEFFAADAAGIAADARIRAAVRYIKGQQQPDGYWRGGGSIANHAQQGLSRPAAARPPLTFDDFTPTAYMVRALKTYGAPAEAADNAARIDRARQWLVAATPRRLQEHAFRLLGLRWSSADPTRDRRRGACVAGAAEREWRVFAAAHAAARCLRHWRRSVRVVGSGRAADASDVSGGAEIPAIDPGRRRHVARPKPVAPIPAVFRERLSLRPRSVDLVGRRFLRGHRDGCGRRPAELDEALNATTRPISEGPS